ncbi:Y-family DNA polymerase [Microvirga thermotolerans]|uniref:DNA-directed DNA polymerase n=1 Tax=Microvirga thermotolerans TaxID=2651334 RepID=A0A5P9JWR7_9HYPH|nr:type VI secretion protein ImpB [Microvirga thermotolerans]QFU17262.1 type VI secretion protein ImpB [Microvirga thermotolerans]
MRKPAGVERLYIDFDSFFASAEQHLQPRLRGRPVGVVPIASEHTGLIAVSREAKAAGVKRGTSVRDARRLCPGIVLVAARHERYVALHRAIVRAVETVLPVKAVCSIDEMVCALTPAEQADALAVARRVKRAVAREIGPALTCSVGLGPNELLAKIAAEMEKPDGLVVLHPDALPGPLLSLPLTDIPGIAKGNAARLARAGIGDMAALWRTQPKELRRLWGSVEGERLWMGLHGYAVERPETQRRMFGHGRVLPAGWRSPAGAYACARVLLAKAASRMRRSGYAAKALALWLTDRHSAGWYGEERFPPTADDPSLLASLARLFLHAERETPSDARLRSVHVTLHDLVGAQEREEDLFAFTPEAQIKRRHESLSLLADRLNAHYRGPLLHWGPWAEIPGGYAGAKIAFNRIPDAEDF